jgi:hypothetical protein
VGSVGVLLGLRLSLAPVRDFRVHGALVALIGQGGQASSGQLGFDAPDPGRLRVVDRARQRPRHPEQLTRWTGHDLQVHPVAVVLAGEERPVRGDPAGPDQRAVEDHEREPGLLRRPDGLPQLRGAGGQQGDGLGDVPPGRRRSYLEPSCYLGERLALAQVDQDQQGLLAGVEPPPQRPDRSPVPADNPGDEGKRLTRQRQCGTVKQHEKPLDG